MRWIILGVMTFALLSTACQPAPPTPTSAPVGATEQAPAAATVSPAEESYPYPVQPQSTAPSGEESYPAPQGQSIEGSGAESAYPIPGAEQATIVSWEEAQNLIQEGQVAQVTQLHNLTVFLTLDDGSMVQTIEPDIDDVFDVIEQCGDACADILMATE
jgi:hypothetical protein